MATPSTNNTTLAGKEYLVWRYVDGKPTPTPATIPTLGPQDVLIRITHSGVCYTDYEFFKLGAPLALGHEGVGIVEAVGDAVTSLKIGDRAGGGFHRDSCGKCNYCLTGQDIHCYSRTIYGTGDYNNGTFGAYYVGKEGFVHKIPDELSSADAAPLQCAGATVYGALVNTIRPRDRVGVMGVGGLGHLAVQFAAKMGAHVVVFSTTADKESEARKLGASEFVLLKDDGLAKLKAPVDVLIAAGSRYPDWNSILDNKVLARNGSVVPLGAPTSGPYSIPADKIFWETFHIRPSLVASKAQHDDMLAFAARNGIKPVNQVYKFEGPETVEKIFRDLQEGKVRYRAVLAL
ncbi:chaperonin 10-like protein [Xylariales sp. PMI_506]|nr:chaperonin 10-like protein [Xylariales sp. PMI_506]